MIGLARPVLIWGALSVVLLVPIAVSATSPLLAWREPVYIAAGFAGVVSMALLLLQPLLAGGYLPGLEGRRGRRIHAWIGAALVAMLIAHVAGLWLTSPPDVVDALLFRSPTPFSAWGVVAMWAAFAAAMLAALRRRLRPAVWRLGHTALVLTTVMGATVHAMLVEGTMGVISKAAVCAFTVAAALKLAADLRSWTLWRRLRA